MDDQLWRLFWAFPLVLLIGMGAIFWLKRLGVGVGATPGQAAPAVLLSRTELSEHTRVLIVEVERQRFVVFESTARIDVQPPSVQTHPLAPRPWGRKT